MILDKYISDLLYRYDCVIVPGFGGFIANKVSAENISSQHKFLPPSKEIAFNKNLDQSDGLLANYIMKAKKISYSHAIEIIDKAVEKWNIDLEEDNTFEIKNVGSFRLNGERNIVFSSDNSVNYLTDSYGLSKFTSIAVKRDSFISPNVKKLQLDNDFSSVNIGRKIVRYAAVLIPLIALGALSYYHNDDISIYSEASINPIITQPVLVQPKVAEEIVEKKEETKVIVPVEVKDLAPVPEVTKILKYHVISGAFSKESNANKIIKRLSDKGVDSEVIGRTRGGLYLVSYDSFEKLSEARKFLTKIKSNENLEGWILKKYFK
ncbi:MAG: SPOR domain-containing protein [Flavobacteriales bacterium]|nr:SPOR domain-containing protein [Flavobacteriales bacterium]